MKRQTLLIICVTIILAGCNHYYYVSSIQNVPLFREKNEFHLSTTYAIGDESESGELQTAYSITNHLGIMANFMITKIGSEEEYDFVSSRNYDIGLGYFKTIGKNAVFEVYSGYGRNKQHHGYSTSNYNSSTGNYEYYTDGDAYLKYGKIYLQPSFGLTFDYFDVAGSFRLNHIRYTYADYDITDHPDDIQILDELPDKSHFILEPAITVRGGWRNIKVQFQASYAEYLNDEDNELFDFVEEPHISIGLYLTLANRYQKKK